MVLFSLTDQSRMDAQIIPARVLSYIKIRISGKGLETLTIKLRCGT